MTQPGTSSETISIARCSFTRTTIESDTVLPSATSAPRIVYLAAGALPGTETPTSQVSVLPGAMVNAVFPITMVQPRGTISVGCTRAVSAPRFFTVKTEVNTLPPSMRELAVAAARSSSPLPGVCAPIAIA